MNSRLQQLADQATEDILGVPILNQERFAQLIVADCVMIAQAGLSPVVAEVIQDRFGLASIPIQQDFERVTAGVAKKPQAKMARSKKSKSG